MKKSELKAIIKEAIAEVLTENNSKIKLHLMTKSHKHYVVDTDGNISLYSSNPQFSGGWKFLGIRSVKSNLFIPFEKITPLLLNNFTMLYKNGNPMFTVVDLDHGTKRAWGDRLIDISINKWGA